MASPRTSSLTCGYTKLGNLEEALDLLERSLRHSGPERRHWVKYDSGFDDLRSHPRHEKILELIG